MCRCLSVSIICHRAIMNCIVLFVTLFVYLALAFDKEKCKQLISPKAWQCCNMLPNYVPKRPVDIRECEPLKSDPPNCAFEICDAKKKAYAGPNDGEFDKANSTSLLFESHPKVAEFMVHNCVNGDLSSFGPPGACDLIKLKYCLSVHTLLLCEAWKDTEECNGFKEISIACASKW